MGIRLVVIYIFLFSTTLWAQGLTLDLDPNKLTFCHITINSKDEKLMFEKKILEQPGGDQFQFVELTELGEPDNWFSNACKAGIKCDVLNISGHFGGEFFGESGLRISSDQLENRSCSRTCEGILNHPAEVYLWGCNTLASKEKDGRGMEWYRDHLHRDEGYPLEQAERIAALRYSPFGTSFRDQMRRTFKGVPHVYGFYSTAPLGKNVVHMLEKYLDQKGNYAAHLAFIRSKQVMQFFDKKDGGEIKDESATEENIKLRKALSVTKFYQLINTAPRCGDDYERELTQDEKINCVLRDEKGLMAEKLNIIQQAFDGENPLVYLPGIKQALIGIEDQLLSPSELEILDKLKNHLKAKKLVLETIPMIKDLPFSYLQLLSLTESLDWLSSEEILAKRRELILPRLRWDMSWEDRDFLCSMGTDEELITYNDLPSDFFNESSSVIHLEALSCLNIRDSRVEDKLLNRLKDESDSYNQTRLIKALANLKPQNPEVHKTIYKFLESKDKNVLATSVEALGVMQVQDLKVQRDIAKFLSHEDMWLAYSAVKALELMQPKDEEITLQLTKAAENESEHISLYAISALSKIKPKQLTVQRKLLEVALDTTKTEGIRLMALMALLDTEHSEIQDQIFSLIEDSSESIKQTAASALINSKNPKFARRLIDMLVSDNPTKIRTAVTYLFNKGNLNKKETKYFLETANKTPPERLKNLLASMQILKIESPKVLALIEKVLKSSVDTETKQTAIMALYNYTPKDKVYTKTVINALKLDLSDKIKSMLVISLAMTGDISKKGIRALKKLANQKASSEPRAMAINLLVQNGEAVDARTVFQDLWHEDEKIKNITLGAVLQLKQIPDNQKLQLETQLKSDNRSNQLVSALTLYKNGKQSKKVDEILLDAMYNPKKYFNDSETYLIEVYGMVKLKEPKLQLAYIHYASFELQQGLLDEDGMEVDNSYTKEKFSEAMTKMAPCDGQVLDKLKKHFPFVQQTWQCP